jgi:hypothetical protein
LSQLSLSAAEPAEPAFVVFGEQVAAILKLDKGAGQGFVVQTQSLGDCTRFVVRMLLYVLHDFVQAVIILIASHGKSPSQTVNVDLPYTIE